jgi:hypothetical protein
MRQFFVCAESYRILKDELEKIMLVRAAFFIILGSILAVYFLHNASTASAAGRVHFPVDSTVQARHDARPANVTLSVPSSLRVVISENGCITTNNCPRGRGMPRNFYHAASKTIVLAPAQGPESLAHKRCHAHQDLKVRNENGGKTSPAHDAWDKTEEGRHWIVATGGAIRVWPQMSERTHLEDFACTCALYLTDPMQLHDIDPLRYGLIRELLK